MEKKQEKSQPPWLHSLWFHLCNILEMTAIETEKRRVVPRSERRARDTRKTGMAINEQHEGSLWLGETLCLLTTWCQSPGSDTVLLFWKMLPGKTRQDIWNLSIISYKDIWIYSYLKQKGKKKINVFYHINEANGKLCMITSTNAER